MLFTFIKLTYEHNIHLNIYIQLCRITNAVVQAQFSYDGNTIGNVEK